MRYPYRIKRPKQEFPPGKKSRSGAGKSLRTNCGAGTVFQTVGRIDSPVPVGQDRGLTPFRAHQSKDSKMGGPGSGRWKRPGRRTVESCLTLDVNDLSARG